MEIKTTNTMVNLKKLVDQNISLLPEGNIIVHRGYQYGIYPDIGSLVNFFPTLKGIMLAICNSNYHFVANVVSDMYSCFILNGDKENASKVVDWYTDTIKPAIRKEIVQILYNIPAENYLFVDVNDTVKQNIKEFFVEVFNHPKIVAELKRTSGWKPYLFLRGAVNNLHRIIKPETAIDILMKSRVGSTKLFVGNIPAITNNTKAQIIWVKEYIKLKSLQRYVRDIHITNDAIDAMELETAYYFLETLSTQNYNPFSWKECIHCDIDKLVKKASVYALASGLPISNIKTKIDRLKGE